MYSITTLLLKGCWFMTSRKRAEGCQDVSSAYLQIVADDLLEEGVFSRPFECPYVKEQISFP